jgi:hypothetical protein
VVFKAHRLHRLRIALGAPGRRDPTLFVGMFAVWAFCAGVALLLTEDAFLRSPVYKIVALTGLSDNVVGAGMLINAAALAYILGDRSYYARIAVLWLTIVVWMFWSILMLGGSLMSGIYSPAAAFQIVCCVWLIGVLANREWA